MYTVQVAIKWLVIIGGGQGFYTELILPCECFKPWNGPQRNMGTFSKKLY